MMIDRASDQTETIKSMPWRPISLETKARVSRSWFAFVSFDVGSWAIGFGFDVAPITFSVEFGPLFVGFERDEPPPTSYSDLPDFSRSLYRITIRKWKLELRLEVDLNIWRLGYMMADAHDHGIYLGPLNLQIEYDKSYDWPDNHTLPPRLQCRCGTPPSQ
jgi:hypothetical protein